MRIALCDYSGHPFQVELSRRLADRGHAVLHLHFAEFQTPKAALVRRPEDSPAFAVEGVSLGKPFDKQSFMHRRAQEIAVGRIMAQRIMAFGAEIAVGCNMPLDAQRGLRDACAEAGIAFVFWLQDLYSAAIRHYLTRRFGLLGDLAGRYYARLEGQLLRSSAAVVAISESFLPSLQAWQVRAERIVVIPNWAPLSEIRPAEKDSEWARGHGLSDNPVALYSGTLGLKHDPALLIRLAEAGTEHGLKVVVASEGPAARQLAEESRARQLKNLICLPFQPMEVYVDALGAADLTLAMIGEEASHFSVPSKILSYMAAGKPTVASITAENDAARMLLEAAAGLVSAPGDTAAFTANALAIASNPALRRQLGENARTFALNRFSIDPIADRFEKLFTRAIFSKSTK